MAAVVLMDSATLCYIDEFGTFTEVTLAGLRPTSDPSVVEAVRTASGSWSLDLGPDEVVMDPVSYRALLPVLCTLSDPLLRRPQRRRDWEDRQYHRPKRRRR